MNDTPDMPIPEIRHAETCSYMQDQRCQDCSCGKWAIDEYVARLEADAHNLRSPVHAICNANLAETLAGSLEQLETIQRLEADAHNLRSPVHEICNANLAKTLAGSLEQMETIQRLEAENRALQDQLSLSQAECSQIRRSYLHEQSLKDALQLKLNEMKEDRKRYQRLRILGVAPIDTIQLSQTGLDEFVDLDLRRIPSRGESIPPADQPKEKV